MEEGEKSLVRDDAAEYGGERAALRGLQQVDTAWHLRWVDLVDLPRGREEHLGEIGRFGEHMLRETSEDRLLAGEHTLDGRCAEWWCAEQHLSQ